jgi:hypothetical protein
LLRNQNPKQKGLNVTFMKNKSPITGPLLLVFTCSVTLLYFLYQEAGFAIAFTAFAILSACATLIILAACWLSQRIENADRRAQDDYFHNPFRQRLTERTFPLIADLPSHGRDAFHRVPNWALKAFK